MPKDAEVSPERRSQVMSKALIPTFPNFAKNRVSPTREKKAKQLRFGSNPDYVKATMELAVKRHDDHL